LGLKRGRGTVGVFGLGIAAVFMAATTLTSSGGWALGFLSVAYAGILLQQPNLSAVCLDTGRTHAGAVFGFVNTAANAAAALSSVAFGYIAASFGSYNAPFFPMVATLSVGALLWLSVDATQNLFEEENTPVAVPA
jgi:MFS transporter, ACS family, glucarate transporter